MKHEQEGNLPDPENKAPFEKNALPQDIKHISEPMREAMYRLNMKILVNGEDDHVKLDALQALEHGGVPLEEIKESLQKLSGSDFPQEKVRRAIEWAEGTWRLRPWS